MKRCVKLGIAIIVVFGLTSAAPLCLQAAAFKLKISVESTPGSATQFILAAFRDALQAEFGDQIEVNYYDSGTLGDEIVHMQQVRTGQLDVVPIGSDAVQLDSKWAVFDMPFLFSSFDNQRFSNHLRRKPGENRKPAAILGPLITCSVGKSATSVTSISAKVWSGGLRKKTFIPRLASILA